jgi:hypothetical protein
MPGKVADDPGFSWYAGEAKTIRDGVGFATEKIAGGDSDKQWPEPLPSLGMMRITIEGLALIEQPVPGFDKVSEKHEHAVIVRL